MADNQWTLIVRDPTIAPPSRRCLHQKLNHFNASSAKVGSFSEQADAKSIQACSGPAIILLQGITAGKQSFPLGVHASSSILMEPFVPFRWTP
jgi:hypothetical protein